MDECHRTQSGELHRVMKAMMPNAVFIGFTGTPLLKEDAQTSLEEALGNAAAGAQLTLTGGNGYLYCFATN